MLWTWATEKEEEKKRGKRGERGKENTHGKETKSERGGVWKGKKEQGLRVSILRCVGFGFAVHRALQAELKQGTEQQQGLRRIRRNMG
eukprot:1021096-Rhodomonas_salina.2